MSVFTPVSRQDLAPWLAGYDLGEPLALRPIAEGVENTNYFLDTEGGAFVLTLFERSPPETLDFYLGLMRHLASRGLSCPLPQLDRANRLYSPLCGKPATLVTRLPGRAVEQASARHCAAIGEWLAGMHLHAADFTPRLTNPRGPEWRAAAAAEVEPFLTNGQRQLLAAVRNKAAELATTLPRGIVHADLFRDNALFVDGAAGAQLGGVIDFYFAGEDAWLFDLAVTVNDWCLASDGSSLDAARSTALLGAYAARRPLSADERKAWPAMLCLAALRFWLSRLQDWHRPRQASPGEAIVTIKDPAAYERILADRLHTAAPLHV
jgi:homoserine kinase type II